MLAQVLERLIDPKDVIPATVSGYATFRAAAASYPILVESANASTPGTLIAPLTAEDWQRLDHYEGVEYRRVGLTVQTGAGFSLPAQVYLPVAGLAHAPELWTLAEWQRVYKAEFIAGLGLPASARTASKGY